MSQPKSHNRIRSRILGAIAAVFAVATVAASSSVLFGPEATKELAGNTVSFVVWFNFLAGFAYLAAAVGLWRAQLWGHRLALAIALATGAVGLAFVWVAVSGTPVEPRTAGALILRTAVWSTLAALSTPGRRA